MTPTLQPLATLDQLYPAGTVIAGRTRRDCFAWVPTAEDAADTVTGLLLAVAGNLPMLAHPSATGASAQQLLAAAGLSLAAKAEPYDSEADARRCIDRWVSEGRRIAPIYPLPADWLPAAAQLVPPALLARLNDKAYLADLVPADWLPCREVLPRAALHRALELLPGEAVVLKVATSLGNGAGGDVFLCHDGVARQAALAALLAETRPFDGLVVERFECFETLWCAGFAVLDDAVRWLGASRHRRTEAGLQAGNVMGCGAPLPDAARQAIEALAAAAGRLGYRGLAGCDVGQTQDGRLLIFDLNFRLNSSSVLLLLQPAAAARSGRPVAIDWHLRAASKPETLAARLLPWIERGQLVVTRVLDHRLLPSRSPLSSASGFLLGADEADCLAVQAAIAGTLA